MRQTTSLVRQLPFNGITPDYFSSMVETTSQAWYYLTDRTRQEASQQLSQCTYKTQALYTILHRSIQPIYKPVE